MARLAYRREHRAVATIGASWQRLTKGRQHVRRERYATVIEAHVRGYLERERCPLLIGGKQAFEFPRRLEDCTLPFAVGGSALSPKSRAEPGVAPNKRTRTSTGKRAPSSRVSYLLALVADMGDGPW